MSVLLIFIPMVLFFIFSSAVIAYTTFGVEKAPAFLRPLMRHVGKALDALDELIEEERKAQQMQQYPTIPPAPNPVADGVEPLFAPAPPITQTRQSPIEKRFFALQEMAINCKFEPRIEGEELLVTSKQLSRLNDYCALAFEEPLSVEKFLAPLGLTIKKVRSQR